MTKDSFPLLSLAEIQSHISKNILRKIETISIHGTILSTNDALWQRIADGKTSPAVCLSESQTSGRGRRGDLWHSPPSGNLYLSICWPFAAETFQNGLSIAIGISLINSLNSEGINDLQLKWPNDILYKRKKLGGILVESRFGKQQNTVVGIGLNFKLPIDTQNKIQQPTTSLQNICKQLPCRNRLAGKIIQNMIITLERFQSHGLSDLASQWHHYDALANQTITLISDQQQINVVAHGINEQGELRYLYNNEFHTLSNSHISIRFAS